MVMLLGLARRTTRKSRKPHCCTLSVTPWTWPRITRTAGWSPTPCCAELMMRFPSTHDVPASGVEGQSIETTGCLLLVHWGGRASAFWSVHKVLLRLERRRRGSSLRALTVVDRDRFPADKLGHVRSGGQLEEGHACILEHHGVEHQDRTHIGIICLLLPTDGARAPGARREAEEPVCAERRVGAASRAAQQQRRLAHLPELPLGRAFE